MGKIKEALNTIIDYTKKLESNIRKLTPKMAEVSEQLNNVKNIVSIVDVLAKEVRALEQGFATVKNVTKAMSCIPIVGTICTQFSNICQSAEAILKGFDKPIDVIRKGLDSADRTVKKVNTVVEKSYQKLVLTQDKLLVYQESGKVIVSFVEIAEEFGLAEDILEKLETQASKIDNCLNDINYGIENFENTVLSEVGKIEEQIDALKSKFSTVLNVFDEISKIIVPIGKAFDTILNVIKPLKWVLNAIGFIFDKLLKPAIDKVLAVTGIKKLIQELENKVLHALGIDKLKEEVENLVSSKICKPLEGVEDFLGNKLLSVENVLEDLNDVFSSSAWETIVDKYINQYIDKVVNNYDPKQPIVIKSTSEMVEYQPLFKMHNRICLKQGRCLIDSAELADTQFSNGLITEIARQIRNINQMAERLKGELLVVKTYRLENDLLLELFNVINEYLIIIENSVVSDDVKKFFHELETSLLRTCNKINLVDQILEKLDGGIINLESMINDTVCKMPSENNLSLVDSVYCSVGNLSECGNEYRNVLKDIDLSAYPNLKEEEEQYKSDVKDVQLFITNELGLIQRRISILEEGFYACIEIIENMNKEDGLYSETLWGCGSTLHNYVSKFHSVSEPVSVVLKSAYKIVEKRYELFFKIVESKIQSAFTQFSDGTVSRLLNNLSDMIITDEIEYGVTNLNQHISIITERLSNEHIGLEISKLVERINQKVDEMNKESVFIRDISTIMMLQDKIN